MEENHKRNAPVTLDWVVLQISLASLLFSSLLMALFFSLPNPKHWNWEGDAKLLFGMLIIAGASLLFSSYNLKISRTWKAILAFGVSIVSVTLALLMQWLPGLR